MKRSDIRVRDPFILLENGRYYLYVTSGDRTLSCYVSDDLTDWEELGVVFTIPDNFWAYKDVWAGEVHAYRGRFYLFVSLLGKNGLRGTQVAVCDTPDGPFVPLTDRAVTPLDQSCIDGTLWVEDGVPYLVYSHDWPDNYQPERNVYVGEIWAAELSEDLTAIVGTPWRLFASDEAPLSRETPHHLMEGGKEYVRYGSDGPFIRRLSDGSLYLIWSPYLEDHYVVLGAVCREGTVKGMWQHLDTPLFAKDGGHAMLFTRKDGADILCLHSPERFMYERAHLFRVAEQDGVLQVVEEL